MYLAALFQMSPILLELRLSNGLHQELHCNSNKQVRYLAKMGVATPTHVGGVKGFSAKTLGFCIKDHYNHHGLSYIVLN